jgi:digeranylgeranylglycerophospholipid reductase
MSDREGYDVVIVGAGPAGSSCAARLARAGHSVVVVDRRAEVGVPSHCAGIIRGSSLATFGLGAGPWVRHVFDAYRVTGPDGSCVSYSTSEPGVLLHRHLLDQELCRRAVAAGAELRLDTAVIDVVREAGRVTGVRTAGRFERPVRARFVVAADGVASRIARLAGVDTRARAGGLAVAVKATLRHARARLTDCHLHLGASLAPGGYLWLLPRADGVADIGAGINPRYARGVPPVAFVHRFVAAHFPGAELRDIASHALSAEPSEVPLWSDGLVLAGEAARQTNPMTGAGIFTAMSSGAQAGEAIAAALESGSDEPLARYAGSWEREFGSFHRGSFALRRRLDGVSDEALCRALRALGPARVQGSVAHALFEVTEQAEREDGAVPRAG